MATCQPQVLEAATAAIGRPVCDTRSMDELIEAVTAEAVAELRQAGARFAYLHGSRAAGRNRADSDMDIAAYFGGRPPGAFDVLLPRGVDLLVLDGAPLELAGRVAVSGRPVDVSIGSTPALVDVATRHFGKITIQAPSTSVCQLQAVDVSAAVTDVHSSHGQEYAQGIDADAVITTTTISDLLAGKIRNATVATNPSAGTLDIGIMGGFVQLDERASLDGDTVRFSPASVSIMGRSAPSSLQSTIDSRLTIQHTLSGLPDHLAPSSLKITNEGIEVSLAAGPTDLKTDTDATTKPKCPAMKSGNL